jgi:hypothetical protein
MPDAMVISITFVSQHVLSQIVVGNDTYHRYLPFELPIHKLASTHVDILHFI